MSFLARVLTGVLFVTILGGALILAFVQTIQNSGFRIGG